MPLYEYQCLDCADTFEKRRTFAEADTPAACPSCQSIDTRKAFATIALLGSPTSAMGEASAIRDTPTLESAGFGGCACGAGGCGCGH